MRLITTRRLIGYVTFPQVTQDGIIEAQAPNYRYETKLVDDNWEPEDDEELC